MPDPDDTYVKDGVTVHVWNGVPTGVEEALVPMVYSWDEEKVIEWTKGLGVNILHKVLQAGTPDGMIMYKVDKRDLEKEKA